MTSRIAGIGIYVPETVVTNHDLAKIVIRTISGSQNGQVSGREGSLPEREQGIWRQRQPRVPLKMQG